MTHAASTGSLRRRDSPPLEAAPFFPETLQASLADQEHVLEHLLVWHERPPIAARWKYGAGPVRRPRVDAARVAHVEIGINGAPADLRRGKGSVEGHEAYLRAVR